MELISNSLAAFCFCNLIISILLLGTSKSHFTTHDHEKKKPVETDAAVDLKINAAVEDQDRRVDEESDALRKRVEEFIQKTNRAWEAEKIMGTQPYITP